MRVTQHHPSPEPDGRRPGIAPFAIDVTTERRGTTVSVTGELDAASSPELGDVLSAAAEVGREVALDLSGTSFIDSAGIRVIVRSMWNLQDAGSSLRLVAVSPMAENILRITGILDVLKDPAP